MSLELFVSMGRNSNAAELTMARQHLTKSSTQLATFAAARESVSHIRIVSTRGLSPLCIALFLSAGVSSLPLLCILVVSLLSYYLFVCDA